jgi:hypothetical protein
MFLNMNRFSLSCVAILTSVATLVSVGFGGRASAEELPGSDTHSRSGSIQHAGEGDRAASVIFHVAQGIRLGEPTTLTNDDTTSFDPLFDVGGTGAGYKFTFTKGLGRGGTMTKVSWPILEGQEKSKSDYSVTVQIGDGAYTCSISDKNGREVRAAGPFFCYLGQRWIDNDWDLHITNANAKRLAEASGAIRTEGTVSLGNGVFESESTQRLDGASDVPKESSTQFDAVMTPTDKPSAPEARMTFKYAIYDEKPGYVKSDGGRLYVRGHVSNYRGGVFEGGSSCDIVTADGHVVENYLYTCTMAKGYHVRSGIADGRIHYITDFTVSKKK